MNGVTRNGRIDGVNQPKGTDGLDPRQRAGGLGGTERTMGLHCQVWQIALCTGPAALEGRHGRG